MQNPEAMNLSETALARLFEDALHVGGSAAPPEPPEWWQDPSFPYVPVTYIGRGGSGFVWKASRRDGHGHVALKLIPFRSDLIRLRQRWSDECSALAKIHHPNLITLVDHAQSPDGTSGWLAMEWIEGSSLEAILRERENIPLKELLPIASQIIDGLHAIHTAGLVHRDINPSNVLLERETGRAVIADFGIALQLDADADQRVTRTCEYPLTPGYSPPELHQPVYQPTPAGDQYSLALTLWQLLTGTLPLGAFPKLHKLTRCPDGLDVVFRKALASNPEERFSDLSAFGEALRQAANRPSRKHILGALFLVIFITATTWWFTRPDPFPKRFQSGNIPVNQGREHYMNLDLTLREDGKFSTRIRTFSLDPLFGFDGRAHLVLRDKHGAILKEIRTHGYGVNGRFIPGGDHDRVDQWESSIPADVARRLKSIGFSATPSAGSLDQRVKANRREIRSDVNDIKAGINRGLKALTDMLTPLP